MGKLRARMHTPAVQKLILAHTSPAERLCGVFAADPALENEENLRKHTRFTPPPLGAALPRPHQAFRLDASERGSSVWDDEFDSLDDDWGRGEPPEAPDGGGLQTIYSDGGCIHPRDPALATASWACSDPRGRVWGGGCCTR